MKLFRLRSAIAVLMLLAMVLSACSGGGSQPPSGGNAGGGTGGSPAPSQPPASDGPTGSVTIPLIGDPTPWPVVAPGLISDIMVGKTLFNTLVRFSEEDGVTPVPDLAESWSSTEDATEWTFNLRKDVKWHDGRPFTAEDVVFTFDAVMDPNVGSRWRGGWVSLDTVTAVDEHTVKFTFKTPFAPMLATLAYNLSIVPKHLLDGQDLKAPQEFIKNPVGTGPFTFKEHVSGSHFVVEANANYHEGAPKIQRVIFKVMPDVNAQVAAMKAGEMDIVWTVAPMHEETLKDVNYTRVNVPQWYWIPVNLTNPLFQDKRVRQALSLGLDRHSIVEQILGGQGEVADGPIPKVLSWIPRDTFEPYPYDPDRALALLAEAGWKPGADGVLTNEKGEKFSFTFLADKGDPLREQIYLVAGGQWKKLGIDVTMQYTEWNTILQLYRDGEYDARVGWWVIKPDPDLYDYFHSKGGLNQIKYSNPKVDELLEQGQQLVNMEDRAKVYQELQEILIDDQPSIFLYYPIELRATSKRLQGLPAIAYRDAMLYLHKAWVTD